MFQSQPNYQEPDFSSRVLSQTQTVEVGFLHRGSAVARVPMGYLEEARQNHVKKKVEEGDDLTPLLEISDVFWFYTVDLTNCIQLLEWLCLRLSIFGLFLSSNFSSNWCLSYLDKKIHAVFPLFWFCSTFCVHQIWCVRQPLHAVLGSKLEGLPSIIAWCSKLMRQLIKMGVAFHFVLASEWFESKLEKCYFQRILWKKCKLALLWRDRLSQLGYHRLVTRKIGSYQFW